MIRSWNVASVLISIACACAPVGPEGPEGPAGPQGEQGADGEDGENGEPGARGASQLVEVVDEPAGANCPAGGRAIRIGVDLNEDGSLQEEEVDDVEYLCADAGSTVADCSIFQRPDSIVLIEDDADKLALKDCTDINDMVVQGDAIRSLAGLENLTSLSRLFIRDAPRLRDLSGLAGLTSIRNGFSIFGDVGVLALTGTSLTSVASVELVDTNLASLAGLEGVQSIRSGIFISDTTALADLDGLEGVVVVGEPNFPQNGRLSISRNASLTDMSGLNRVTTVTSDVSVDGNVALEVLGLESLSTVGSSFSVTGNPSLPTCQATRASAGLNDLAGAPLQIVVIQQNDDSGVCP